MASEGLAGSKRKHDEEAAAAAEQTAKGERAVPQESRERPAEDSQARSLPPALAARLKARGLLKESAPPASSSQDQAGPRSSQSSAGATAAAAAPSTSGQRLPLGWYSAIDPRYNAIYYFHPGSGQRSWEIPKAPPPVRRGCPISAGQSCRELPLTPWSLLSPAQLPPGWQETVDNSTGKVYYFNRASGQTQWNRPGPGPTVPASAGPALGSAASEPDAAHEFAPAARFEGPRPGYAFKAGALGLGYYKDETPAPAVSAATAHRGGEPGYERIAHALFLREWSARPSFIGPR